MNHLFGNKASLRQESSAELQRMLLSSILLGITCLIMLCGLAIAEDTYSSQPSHHSSTDHFYDTLYATDFDAINDFKLHETTFFPQGYILCQNGNMEIKGVSLETHYAESRRIDYYTGDFLLDGRSYEVWFEFKVSDDTQKKFTIFYNGEIHLYVTTSGGTQKLFSQIEAGGEDFIMNMNPNQWYFFWISAFHQATYMKYELIIQGVNYGARQYTNTAAIQWAEFGDRFPVNEGRGWWNLFQLNGWSKAQYFNNFDDGSCHEFADTFYKAELAGRSTGETSVKVQNNALFFDSYWNTGPEEFSAWIQTEHINYDPSETWRISLDFRIFNTNQHDFCLVTNGQANIVIDSGNIYYTVNGVKQLIKNLMANRWYFLELEKTAVNAYKIIIDTDVRATGCVFEIQLSPNDYLYIGNPEGSDQCVDGIYIDYLKLIVENPSQADTDSDGLGDSFEYETGVNSPYDIPVWSTDFEDRHFGNVLDSEELGWEFDPKLDDPSASTIWERGEITYLDPNQLYPTPAKGYGYGIFPGSNGKVLGVDLDSTYQPSCYGRISTPIISTAKVQSGLKIYFEHWMNCERAGVNGDGGQILISTDGGTSYSLLSTAHSSWWVSQLNVFNGEPGISVNAATYWERVWIELGSGYVGAGKSIKLAFVFKSDSDNNVGSGWYIDDIKIYGSMKKSGAGSTDTDGDGLGDYEEVMKYGSSPFISDTDGDSLTDNEEVKEVALATWEFFVNYNGEYNSWSDPLTKDIWVEVDEMAAAVGDPALREWSYNNYEVRGLARDCFATHEIKTHFVYSEGDIGVIIGATSAQLEAIAHIEADGGHREDDNNEYRYYHYLLWANTHDDAYLGEAWASHWYTVVFAKHVSLDSVSKRSKTLMFTLGLNLGLWWYNSEYYDEQSNNPPATSMKTGVWTYIDYLDEQSDWTYDYQSEDRIVGGWEYAHTDLDVFKRGLDFSGILKDKDFNDTGWTY